MEWYSGSINEAVQTSKVNKAVFVVFVAGKDEVSKEVIKVIDTPEISSCLKSNDFVAIKLESGTADYNFFAQIYQLVPVPSLFFIGLNGQPLEVVAGNVTEFNLKEKIDAVLTKVGKGKSNFSTAFINAEQNAAQSSASCSSSSAISTESTKKSVTNASIDSKQSPPAEQADSVTSNTDNDSISKEEIPSASKIERARALIELQKKQQIEKEREEEKKREIERRDIGKHMQNARRRQQEMELALAHEERMKEKALEREARERVMQQIAQDKLERKHREQALLQATKDQQNQNQPQPQSTSAFAGDGIARIQFRLPTGTPHLGKFEAQTTLSELRAYVTNNIDLPFRRFSLSTSFPRRDLTAEDDERTLLDLELVPTAVILILPCKNSGSKTVISAHDDSFWSRFMWALFAPIFTVYNYIAGYFSGGPSGNTNDQSNSSSTVNGSDTFGGNNAGHASGVIAHNVGEQSRSVRSRGNIHRLHSGTDDNDENNTWNGNSTQQM